MAATSQNGCLNRNGSDVTLVVESVSEAVVVIEAVVLVTCMAVVVAAVVVVAVIAVSDSSGVISIVALPMIVRVGSSVLWQ